MIAREYVDCFFEWDDNDLKLSTIFSLTKRAHRRFRRRRRLEQLFVDAGDDAVRTYAEEMAAVASALLGPDHELTRMLAETSGRPAPAPRDE